HYAARADSNDLPQVVQRGGWVKGHGGAAECAARRSGIGSIQVDRAAAKNNARDRDAGAHLQLVCAAAELQRGSHRPVKHARIIASTAEVECAGFDVDLAAVVEDSLNGRVSCIRGDDRAGLVIERAGAENIAAVVDEKRGARPGPVVEDCPGRERKRSGRPEYFRRQINVQRPAESRSATDDHAEVDVGRARAAQRASRPEEQARNRDIRRASQCATGQVEILHGKARWLHSAVEVYASSAYG